MWIVLAALRRPITVVVLVAGIVLAALLAIARMRRDIFPAVGAPVIYVAQTWPGLTPAQMEGLIVSKYEYHFLYIAGIEHIESASIGNVAIMKLYFHPDTDVAFAMAQVTAMAYRSTAFMPPGTVPPFIMRLDAGSYPVAQLVFESPGRTGAELQDLALYRVRPILATMPGVSAPPPFGGRVRMLVVTLDPRRLRRYSLSPEDVAVAIAETNVTLPQGVVRIGSETLIANTNEVVARAEDLDGVPIRTGSGPAVFIRDVGHAADYADVTTEIALVNGRDAVYMPITKRADASTLAVVDEVRRRLPDMRAAVPRDIAIRIEFDQSIYVRGAIRGLLLEAALGALLTGLVVALFLGDLRGAAIVVTSIPTSLLLATVELWLTGQTVNIMTLGGLALAVGILVDEATVAIENIHTHLARGKRRAAAVADAMREVRAPQLIAMLCICAVFLPAFFMTGTPRALFGALSLAVAFAMTSSYAITSTLVPVLAVWLLREHATGRAARGGLFERLRERYARAAGAVLGRRAIALAAFALATGGAIVAARALPEELFPLASPHQFQLRVRAPSGTRLRATEETVLGVLDEIGKAAGEGGLETSIAHIGTTPPAYPADAMYAFNGGPHEATLLVALRPEVARGGLRFYDELRARLHRRFPGVAFSFEAADVVSQVLNSNAPNPVSIAVSGNDLATTREYAERIRAAFEELPELRDLAIPLALDYPSLDVEIARARAAQLGVTARRVGAAIVEATWSSQLTHIIFWIDPASGLGYFVSVRIHEPDIASADDLAGVPVAPPGEARPLLRDVARITRSSTPGEYDHLNSIRMIRVVANAGTRDLERIARAIEGALARVGPPPAQDVKVAVRGQIEQLRAAISGLERGLAIAIVVVFLLLAATFESFRDALAVLLGLPAVLAGVVAMLLATGTALNMPSFMGTIMSIGVSVANAVLLVKFFEDRRRAGDDARTAAREAARERLRPILMTSLSMLVGMVPMSLGLGEGGAQNAPLGRAVIGGLACSTLATIFILPATLSLVHGKRPFRSASLDPSDPESPHFRGEAPPETTPA
jgi:multidrug efflux pump subunit AcrB